MPKYSLEVRVTQKEKFLKTRMWERDDEEEFFLLPFKLGLLWNRSYQDY